ncbi:MAG TPA: SusD/RagB family nutrient-binding outer membrane lipoprotein [Gemmatimonadaceae bacterium]|nr:SusD/RagB family nutrient-binding outer membrane lipoprotein [Gemmatimonadaceae bacterium]
MMNIKRGTVASVVALALTATACNNDKLTGLNRNPNSPEDVPAATLFTAGTVRGVNLWLGAGYDLRGTEFVAQHLAEVQYPDEDRYARLTGGSTQAYFDNPYIQELEDYQKVIAKGTASNEAGVYGPALVMRTWEFGYLTNTWGDIPYFEALKGDEEAGSLSPKYDAQKDIYADFFKVLDKASKDMQGGSGSLGGGDPIFGGSLTNWQRFSNSLRARYALQLVNVDAATTRTQLAAAFAAPGGVFQSNADNAELHWPGDGVYNNPWAVNFATRDDHRVSLVLMNLLKATNDPRIPIYAQPTPADPTVYKGAPNALLASDAAPYITAASRPGAVFYPGNTAYGFYGGSGNSFPSFLMTYAEVEFIKAEAVERGLATIAGSAASHYIAGIRASMEQWGVPTAQINAYLAQGSVAYKGGTAGLAQIAQQKWIALYTDGGTAWSEWRRTCQPASVQPGVAATQSTVPRRFQYSITEKSVNIENVNAAITAQGADTFNSRMYWDKNPTAAPTYFTGCGVRGQAPPP